MTTYREIHGKAVKSVSTDPSAETDAGQIWYNTTSNTFKSILNLEAWASAAAMASGQRNGAGFGTQTALVFAAGIGPGGPAIATTQEYNGNGWSTATDYPTSTYNLSGFGTLTAGAAVGGYPSENATKEYDGTNWTAGGNYPTGIHSLSTHGTQTAAIAAGGSPAVTTSATYNGTAWTATPGSLNTGRGMGGMAGTTTAAVLMGGGTGPDPGVGNATEECDGSTWTSVTNTPTNIETQGATGAQTAAIYFGGRTPSVVATAIKYDGTTYSSAPSMGTARYALARGTLGTSLAAIGAGGYNSGTKDLTEEFNSSVNVITAAAWASGPTSINTTSEQNAGTDGPSSAYAVWGGRTIPATTSNLCEEFDGTSFSAGGALNTAARTRCGGGTLTAAWCANGEQPVYISNVEEYNGTSWSEVTDTPAASSLQGGAGPQTAGVAVQSQLPAGPYPRLALEYDGTNWTTGGATNTARTSSSAGMVGTSTNALICGGEPTPIANTETYDGSSWTEVADMITALGQCTDGTFGTTSAAIQCGGKTSPSPGNAVTTAQTWNGTNWATSPNLGQARKSQSTSGSTTAGFIAKGQTAAIPTAITASEEFSGETSALNVKTLTQS